MGRYIVAAPGLSAVAISPNKVNAGVNYQAVSGDRIFCTAGNQTISLPLNTICQESDIVQIVDQVGIAGTNNITVARNGSLIQGLAQDLTINVNNAAITLFYTVALGWSILVR